MSLRNAIWISFIIFIFFLIFNLISENNNYPNIEYSSTKNSVTYTPESDCRNLDQTLLTYPEWYLVYSPEEFANLTKAQTADKFPFYREIWQYWYSYYIVTQYAKQINSHNLSYQVMLWVIGTSTSIEYFLRGIYENSIGRITVELAGRSEEDDYAHIQAVKYANFIKIYPWYEFDFYSSLKGLWQLPIFSEHFIRKIERRYILTSEYLIKFIYAKLIGILTNSAYGVEKLYTIVALDKKPIPNSSTPDLHVLGEVNNVYLVQIPRYDAFKDYALNLANQNINFVEVAGNQSFIGLSVLTDKELSCKNCQILFQQPIYTTINTKREFIITKVSQLSNLLHEISEANATLEHIYDY